MKEIKVAQSASIVGSFTLLSRCLGMIRDVIIAYHFGTSLLASAFFFAFLIPNLFRRLFGEGALSAAFIPVVIETRTDKGEGAAWSLTSKVFTMTAALLSVIALVGIIMISMGLHIPGLSEKWITTLGLSRIMLPYLVFICMAAISMAVLNSYNHFSTSAFAPCLLNIILIITMLCVFPLLGGNTGREVTALAWAVLVAGMAQVIVQIPALKRFGCPCRFSSPKNDPRIRQILTLMAPAALGVAITQFNVLIDKFLAMWIAPWALASLSYSERMIYLPLGVIATALSTVLLPTFSTQTAAKSREAMRKTIVQSLRYLLYIMIPAAMGLLALAPFVLETIFDWGGQFGAESTLLSSRALRFYAPGLIVFSVAKVFVPAFYAMQDTKTPVRIGIYTVGLNLLLNIIFILILPLYWKHAGMAFSTVLAETAGMIVLGTILTRRIPGLQWKGIFVSFLRCLLSGIIMALVVWGIAHMLLPWLLGQLPVKAAQITTLVVSIGAGMILYIGLTILFKSPEIRELKTMLRRK